MIKDVQDIITNVVGGLSPNHQIKQDFQSCLVKVEHIIHWVSVAVGYDSLSDKFISPPTEIGFPQQFFNGQCISYKMTCNRICREVWVELFKEESDPNLQYNLSLLLQKLAITSRYLHPKLWYVVHGLMDSHYYALKRAMEITKYTNNGKLTYDQYKKLVEDYEFRQLCKIMNEYSDVLRNNTNSYVVCPLQFWVWNIHYWILAQRSFGIGGLLQKTEKKYKCLINK